MFIVFSLIFSFSSMTTATLGDETATFGHPTSPSRTLAARGGLPSALHLPESAIPYGQPVAGGVIHVATATPVDPHFFMLGRTSSQTASRRQADDKALRDLLHRMLPQTPSTPHGGSFNRIATEYRTSSELPSIDCKKLVIAASEVLDQTSTPLPLSWMDDYARLYARTIGALSGTDDLGKIYRVLRDLAYQERNIWRAYLISHAYLEHHDLSRRETDLRTHEKIREAAKSQGFPIEELLSASATSSAGASSVSTTATASSNSTPPSPVARLRSVALAALAAIGRRTSGAYQSTL